jgi:hypothetical protein
MHTTIAISGFLLLTAITVAGAQHPTALPLKYVGPPTVADITAGDLMTRIYQYADDSLMGRQVGSEWNLRATAMIEREVRRLGLLPGGENGTYYQDLPMGTRALDTSSTLTAGGNRMRVGRDFVATIAGPGDRRLENVETVFAGSPRDTLTLPAAGGWRGKIVVLRQLQDPAERNRLQGTAGYRRFVEALEGAIVATITGDTISPAFVRFQMAPANPTYLRGGDGRLALFVTNSTAERMLGRGLMSMAAGAAGNRVSLDVRRRETRIAGGRNVIAILPGSDPSLRGQYVAVGAHNDHVGFTRTPQDHDSIKVFMREVRPQGADSPNRQATAEEASRINAALASLRRVNRQRPDSIRNGADDDASGSMGLLEIAEWYASLPTRPRRSIIFVWHTGEEAGMWGSGYFADNPTVPRDSIVAQLNIDMIGRGGPSDITGQAITGGLLHGDERYLQILGSRRLSTELGDMVDAVNGTRRFSFRLDYAMDANGHPQNIYCRSDHYSYAQYGIPIVFFTTGGHADYHQVTDEPQYIRYEHTAEVARFIGEVGLHVGNRPNRPVVDKPVPDRNAGCRQ